MENMKKNNEKKQEKGMNRTEFAQEYSMDHCKSNGKQAENSRKQRTPKREEERVLINKGALDY